MKTTLTDRDEPFYTSPEGPKLIYNEKTMQGEIKFPQHWKNSSYVWRLDCLQDWIERLQDEYESVCREHREQYENDPDRPRRQGGQG